MNMSTFTNVTEMKYWCYKVLPLVYDDSLSYYEVLCKATEKLNEVIENNNNIPEYIKEVVAEGGFFDQIQEQIAELNDGTSATATADRFTGELIWLNGNLYRITRNMLAGDQYVTSSEGVTGNIEKLTFEQWCERYRGLIKASITSHDEKYNSESSQTYSVDDWMWWQGAFYTVIKDIAEGDRLVVGRNVQTSDLEQLIGGKIKKELAEIKVLIQNETDARTEADKVLTDSIAQEVSNRSDADTKLQSELDTEVSNRSDADKVLTDSVAQEVSDRSALIEKDGDTTVVKGEPVKISSSLPMQYGAVKDVSGKKCVEFSDGNVPYYLLTNDNKLGTSDIYNIVTAGGADSTGTTDSSDILQNAFDNYSCIFIPVGSYKIEKELNITKPITVFGTGSQSQLHFYGNYGIVITATSTMKNFAIIGENSSTANGMTITNVTNFVIDGCYASGFFNGFKVDTTTYGVITNCLSEKNYSNGFYVTNNISREGQVIFSDCLSELNDGFGFLYYNTSANNMPIGNITSCSTYANTSGGIGLESVAGAYVEGLRVNGGFYGSDGVAEIYIEKTSYPVILNGVYFEESGKETTGRTKTTPANTSSDGIVCANNYQNVLSNCTFINCAHAGVRNIGSLVMQGCTVRSCNTGITNAGTGSIANCIIDSNNIGVQYSGTQQSILLGNTFTSNTTNISGDQNVKILANIGVGDN